MKRRYVCIPFLLVACFALSSAAQEFAAPERLPAPLETKSELLPGPAEEGGPKESSLPADGADAAYSVGALLGGSDFYRTYWDPWEGSLELGLSGTDGNTETFNVRAGAKAKLASEGLVHTLEGVYLDKTAGGVSTARTGLLDGRLEWPMKGSPWNYFMHGLFEYDQFKAFQERISADTGFGYELIQTDATMLISRAGLSTSREIGGPENRFNPELLFGVEFKHKFDEKHRIGFKADYYPTVTDFADFRLNSNAFWEMVLSDAWGLSLKLSVIDRYDSTPHSARPNDLDYSTLLIWAF